MSPVELCTFALKGLGANIAWENSGFYRHHSQEAQKRGYTLEQCAFYSGRTTQIASSNLSSSSLMLSMPDKEVCNKAIIIKTSGVIIWNTSYSYAKYSKEAKRRGITLEQCATLTGRTTTQNAQAEKKQQAESDSLLAKFGDVVAQHNLGVRYEDGEGVRQDYAEALKWYRKAAESGYAPSQVNLGRMYANGTGVRKDPREAHKWYLKAAEQGVAQAQYNLGIRSFNGEGVVQDNAEAERWFRKAASQGLANA
jgi:hypothetical protein